MEERRSCRSTHQTKEPHGGIKAGSTTLKESIKKNKKPLFSRTQPVLSLDLEEVESPVFVSCSHRLDLSGSDADSDVSLKENKCSPTKQGQKCLTGSTGVPSQLGRLGWAKESLETNGTERGQNDGRRRGKGKNGLEKKQDRGPVVISDSSDDEFETFLMQLKTPKSGCPEPRNVMDDLKGFIVDSAEEFSFDLTSKRKGTSSRKGLKNAQSHGRVPPPEKKPPSPGELVSPVFVNDSSDDSSIVVKSTYRDRIKANGRNAKTEDLKDNRPASADGNRPTSANSRAAPISTKQHPAKGLDPKDKLTMTKPAIHRAASWEPLSLTGHEFDSSEDEFESLMVRIKNRTRPQTPTSTASKNVELKTVDGELGQNKPLRDTSNGPTKKPEKSRPKAKSLPKEDVEYSPPLPLWSPPPVKGISDIVPPSTQTRSAACRVPNCFLQDLTNSTSPYVKNFKQKKHELTQRLFAHYNSTIFDLKLPENMEIIWNKKMRKTAGYCVTGQKKHGLEVQRYARIELSEKVCDSADRLRDTLIHEICHAATWLINAVRDGHGQFWRCYAKKSTVIHPELPMVTRCHSYEINYKFTYQCTRCTTTIGRHSKSLDTQRFVCALCQGQLVLLPSVRKDGSASSTKLTPFAKFVKDNYGSAKKGATGLSHAEVMRKLSAEFAAKAQISAS
ncbi:germ cell nuclear acidic protein isoform X2 [Pleurodeles waltl]|uniref:germ cell nuclear acidic protein isoform X2 n=1 Tax=Pleurodeles waltl TaxID=8319 RepID=UPI003709AD45